MNIDPTAPPSGRVGGEDMAYRARALAQAHPLTPLAKGYLDQAVAEQRTSQPVPEIGIWAGAAMLAGYCLRRVEEEDMGVHLEAATDDREMPAHERLDEVAVAVAADLRSDDGGQHFLAAEGDVIDGLDSIIRSEVSRRLDHWRDSIDDKAAEELEEYLTWWAVKGYALRVAETMTGALA